MVFINGLFLGVGIFVVLALAAIFFFSVLAIWLCCWVIAKIAPEGSEATCLLEAIVLRGIVVWDNFKSK